MAVKLAQKRAVKWPVTVSIPQDGGNTVKATATVEFHVLTQDELEQVAQEGKDLLERAVAAWSGFQLDGDEELAVSDENKKRLLSITYVRAALFGAYSEVQQGRAAARKN